MRRDEEGAEEDEATSRSKCSTPISSASSASIDVGICVNVRCVVVPSCEATCQRRTFLTGLHLPKTHISDLLNCKVGVGGDTRIAPATTRSDIHNHHHGSRTEPLKQLRDLQIGRSQTWARVVEPDRLLLGYEESDHRSPQNMSSSHSDEDRTHH